MQPFQFLTSGHQPQPLLQTQPVLVPHQGRLMPQIPTILTSQFEIESKWTVRRMEDHKQTQLMQSNTVLSLCYVKGFSHFRATKMIVHA